MIIDTYLNVTINGRTYDYWKSKGYDIPLYKDRFGRIKFKRGTKILVKIEDLPKNSQIKVNCKCDVCNQERILKFSQYNPICHKCSLLTFKKELNPNWKGGFPKCKLCEQELKDRRSTYCVSCLWKIQVGSNHPKYNDKITNEERFLSRNRGLISDNYFWKKEVLERDNHTCQKCCSKEHLHVHHIDNFKENFENRYNINNGITLCKDCHKEIHKKFGYKTNKKQLKLFLN